MVYCVRRRRKPSGKMTGSSAVFHCASEFRPSATESSRILSKVLPDGTLCVRAQEFKRRCLWSEVTNLSIEPSDKPRRLPVPQGPVYGKFLPSDFWPAISSLLRVNLVKNARVTSAVSPAPPVRIRQQL